MENHDQSVPPEIVSEDLISPESSAAEPISNVDLLSEQFESNSISDLPQVSRGKMFVQGGWL